MGGKAKNIDDNKRAALTGPGADKMAVVSIKERDTNQIRARAVVVVDLVTQQEFLRYNAWARTADYTDGGCLSGPPCPFRKPSCICPRHRRQRVGHGLSKSMESLRSLLERGYY